MTVRVVPIGRDVQLPTATRFVAGFVHETLSLDEHMTSLSAIERARHQQVDVAKLMRTWPSDPRTGHRLLALTRQLVLAW